MERAEVEPGGGPRRDIRARREMENFGAVGLLAERRAREDVESTLEEVRAAVRAPETESRKMQPAPALV